MFGMTGIERRFPVVRRLLLTCLLLAPGCKAPAPPVPAESAGLEELAAEAEAGIEAFFGEPFPEPYDLRVFPDRASFDDTFPPEWGVERTECWMVAFGVADRLHVIDPVAWETDACEHDGEDEEHVRGIVAHELVHVFHGQHNPTGDFTGMEGMGWFLEGLAVLVSGQLEGRQAEAARAAFEQGSAPTRLEDAWSGEHRYGVSGSLVAYVDATWGRDTLCDLLEVTDEEELLARLGIDEEGLLSTWRSWVIGVPESGR